MGRLENLSSIQESFVSFISVSDKVSDGKVEVKVQVEGSTLSCVLFKEKSLCLCISSGCFTALDALLMNIFSVLKWYLC